MKEDNRREEGRQSFIAEARREQIVEAAIRTLAEIGYVNASLAQIAKRARISTALISYHFADKSDLMNHLLMKLLEQSAAYVLERTRRETEPRQRLLAFITASLAYQGTHRDRNIALIEIIFNARTPDNVPYYLLADEEDDLLMVELQRILRDGQERGVFGSFNVDVMASVIQAAIGEYMLSGTTPKKVDLETYCSELIAIVDSALQGR